MVPWIVSIFWSYYHGNGNPCCHVMICWWKILLQGIDLPAQRIVKMPLMQIWLQHLESWRCTSFLSLCSLDAEQHVQIPGLLNPRSDWLTRGAQTLWLGDRISLAHSHTLFLWKEVGCIHLICEIIDIHYICKKMLNLGNAHSLHVTLFQHTPTHRYTHVAHIFRHAHTTRLQTHVAFFVCVRCDFQGWVGRHGATKLKLRCTLCYQAARPSCFN